MAQSDLELMWSESKVQAPSLKNYFFLNVKSEELYIEAHIQNLPTICTKKQNNINNDMNVAATSW